MSLLPELSWLQRLEEMTMPKQAATGDTRSRLRLQFGRRWSGTTKS